jgi:flagellar motility protein MotE (MotC chaperone)
MEAKIDRIAQNVDLLATTQKSPSTSSSQSPEELRRIQEEKDLRMKAKEAEKAEKQQANAELKARLKEIEAKYRKAPKSDEKVTNKRQKKTAKADIVVDMVDDMAACAAAMRNGD